MAAGDAAAAKGMAVVSATGKVNLGDDEINVTRDYIAKEIDDRTTAVTNAVARTPKITVNATAPTSPAVGDLWAW